jgi:hypothetical protein
MNALNIPPQARQRRPEFIMNFTRDPLAFLFSHRLQPGRQRAQLSERMLQFLLSPIALSHVLKAIHSAYQFPGAISQGNNVH